MYVSVSVVASVASTRGAPSNPTAARWARRAWVAVPQGAIGLRTVLPTRFTSPRLAVPPGSGPSAIGTVGAATGAKEAAFTCPPCPAAGTPDQSEHTQIFGALAQSRPHA